MARKRFSDLERIYQALKLSKVANNSLPADLDFVKYAKWKDRETTRSPIVRPPLNGEVAVGVISFSLDATNAAAKIKVNMTGRSKAAFDSLATKADFGVATTLTGYNANTSFTPAKARVSLLKAGTTETSGITGRKYKKRTENSYTFVHGQTTGEKYYQEAIAKILTGSPFVPSGNNPPVYSISFDPEEFRRD